jgi:hypothetical protein
MEAFPGTTAFLELREGQGAEKKNLHWVKRTDIT